MFVALLFCDFYRNKKEILSSDTDPLLDSDAEIINNDAKEAEVLSKYFRAAIAIKLDDVSISQNDFSKSD